LPVSPQSRRKAAFLLAAAGERLLPGAVSNPVRRYAVTDPMETV
jgi:hypothetical protein